MNIFRVIFFTIWPLFSFASPAYWFMPPQDWDCIHPQNLAQMVQIGFIGKEKSNFRPSLNLATEEVNIPLKEYLKCVRQIHEEEMKVQWRDLGPFTFESGKGRLTEITSPSPLGDIKMLQAILIRDNVAYILTAAVLKDEFPSFQSELLSSMRSLTVAPDLFCAIRDDKKKNDLEETFCKYASLSDSERQDQWLFLNKLIKDEYSTLGACWQLLVLKKGYELIFPGQKPPSQ